MLFLKEHFFLCTLPDPLLETYLLLQVHFLMADSQIVANESNYNQRQEFPVCRRQNDPCCSEFCSEFLMLLSLVEGSDVMNRKPSVVSKRNLCTFPG